jgi:hypothetical protein
LEKEKLSFHLIIKELVFGITSLLLLAIRKNSFIFRYIAHLLSWRFQLEPPGLRRPLTPGSCPHAYPRPGAVVDTFWAAMRRVSD